MLRAENGQLKDDMENKGASSQDSILKLNDKITKNMKHISELEAKTKQMENSIRELSMANREQASKIVAQQNELKGKNSNINELEVHNYELNMEIRTHEINEKSLKDTLELLNAANDNFKALLEKYRFLLESNMTVRKRSITTKKSVKTKKSSP